MKKKIDWLNHFLEFIVVIIGILIAFQMNQCSAEKKQDKTIETHMSQIKEETEFNIKQLESAIAFAELNLKKTDTILTEIRNDGNLNKINRLALELLNIGNTYVRKNSYSTLVDSGDIRFMTNFEDKKRIINLYEFYVWVEAYDKISLENYKNDFFPYIKDNLDMLSGHVQPKAVYFNKPFANSLATYRYMLFGKLGKYKEALALMNTYLEEIK